MPQSHRPACSNDPLPITSLDNSRRRYRRAFAAARALRYWRPRLSTAVSSVLAFAAPWADTPKTYARFPAELNLSELNGANGFTVQGVFPWDFLGDSVSGAGDINGDGFDDLAIGALGVDPTGYSIYGPTAFTGETYVVFGKAGGFTATLDPRDLDGLNGFAIEGVSGGDAAGTSVSYAGDVNGDGISDLLIGSESASRMGYSRIGEAYVVFGRQDFGSDSFKLASLDGTNGFVIQGVSEGDRTGRSVSGAGDFNGDGIDDILIGARGADPVGKDDAGSTYVVFGSDSTFPPSISPTSLNGINGFTLVGAEAGDESGGSVSAAGDVNSDGVDDVIIGARLYGLGSSRGGAHVVFGKQAPTSALVDLGELNGVNGFSIDGFRDSGGAGYSVSEAGDVNGDGIDDVIVGAPFSDGRLIGSPFPGLKGPPRVGQVFVVFGQEDGYPPRFDPESLDGTNGFFLQGSSGGDQLGASVSGAGDINGDGIDDIVIAGPFGDPIGRVNAGEVYVVFGRDTPRGNSFPAILDLDSIDGSNGFKVNGIDEDDRIGISVGRAGDINGDGADDLIIGAPRAGGEFQQYGGEAYMIFGRPIPEPTTALITAAGMLPWLTRRRRSL